MSTTSGGFRSLSPTWKHAKRSDTLHTSTGARFFTRGAGSTGASSTSSSHLDMQSGGLSSWTRLSPRHELKLKKQQQPAKEEQEGSTRGP